MTGPLSDSTLLGSLALDPSSLTGKVSQFRQGRTQYISCLRSNDAVKPVRAVLTLDTAVCSDANHGIALCTACANATPPVARDGTARHEAQSAKFDFLVHVGVPLEHGAYVVIEQHVDHLCRVGDH